MQKKNSRSIMKQEKVYKLIRKKWISCNIKHDTWLSVSGIHIKKESQNFMRKKCK